MTDNGTDNRAEEDDTIDEGQVRDTLFCQLDLVSASGSRGGGTKSE